MLWLAGWWAFLCVIVAHRTYGNSLPVNVNLRHSWHNYSEGAAHAATLLEMVEAVHEVFPAAYFRVVSKIWSSESSVEKIRSASHQELYEGLESLLLDYVEKTSVPSADARMAEWRLYVAQHLSAARIESLYQTFNTTRDLRMLNAACDTFVFYGGRSICTAEELRAALSTAADSQMLYSDDRIYPGTHVDAPEVVLYADPYSSALPIMHKDLVSLAEERLIRYVLRWRPTSMKVPNPRWTRYMAGFGTKMHLKKVDYLVLDDRQVDEAQPTSVGNPHAKDRVSSLYETVQSELLAGRSSGSAPDVQEAVLQQSNLTVPDHVMIGQAAAHAILKAADPMSTLEALVYDFPAHAAALANYSKTLPAADPVLDMLNNQELRFLRGGLSMVWLNGRPLAESELDTLSFFQAVRDEHRLVNAFGAPELGVQAAGVEQILTSPMARRAFSPSPRESVRYDTSDAQELKSHPGVPVITWVNDLESEEYATWPQTLVDMAEYRWSSGFPLIARNFFQLVVLVDLRDPAGLRYLSAAIAGTMTDYPFRWGLVPFLDDEKSEQMAQVLWYAAEYLQPFEIAAFLGRLAKAATDMDGKISVASARAELSTILRGVAVTDRTELEAFVDHGMLPVQSEARTKSVRMYLQRIYPRKSRSHWGVAFLNGQEIPLSERLMTELAAAMAHQLQVAGDDVLNGKIDEKKRYSVFFYELRSTLPRRSLLVDMLDEAKALSRPDSYVLMPEVFNRMGPLAEPLRHFVYMEGDCESSLRILGDLDDSKTRDTILAALSAMTREDTAPFRLSFVHFGGHGVLSDWIMHAMSSGILSSIPPSELLQALLHDDLAFSLAQISDAYDIQATNITWSTVGHVFGSQASISASVNPSLMINGQVLLNVTDVTPDEVVAAMEWEKNAHLGALHAVLGVPEEPRDIRAQVIEFAVATLGYAFTKQAMNFGPLEPNTLDRQPVANFVHESPLTFVVGDPQTPMHAVFVLNPLGDEAPRLVALARMLVETGSVQVSMFMNPHISQVQMPLQYFSRYDYRIAPEFDDEGNEVPPTLHFANLPSQAVLTMEMEAPRSLVVMADEAIYDLDNVRLADAHGPVNAVYAVQSLLLEGHARADPYPTPRGLQLVLETDDGTTQLDTIVMENLGYFQFRAQPGQWRLMIREGRSADLYELRRLGLHGWTESGVEETGSLLQLHHLQGLVIYPTFAKRLGRATDELIADVHASDRSLPPALSGARKFANKALRWMRGRGRHADINVFTLASGHLYERMTYIMIVRYVNSLIQVFCVIRAAVSSFGLWKISCRPLSRRLFRIWPKRMDLNTSSSHLRGRAGSVSRLRSSALFGPTRFCSWTSCFLWTWIVSFLLMQTRLCARTCRHLWTWICMERRTAILLWETTAKTWTATASGSKATGNPSCGGAHITFRPCTWWICSVSATWPLVTFCAGITSVLRQTRIRSRIWTRTCRTTVCMAYSLQCNRFCRFIRSIKPGCGAKRGALMTGSLKPRPLTCAATPRPRSPSWTAHGDRSPSGRRSTTKLRRSRGH